MQTWQFLYFLFNKYIKLNTGRFEAFISMDIRKPNVLKPDVLKPDVLKT
jgi:hypothetical protein